jgi:vacuolar-type H+-ATPase subunit D/Vma8
MQFTRLLEKIQSTKPRLKVIEKILLPCLKAEQNYIRMALEECEHSEHNRLKIAKDIVKEQHIQTQRFSIILSDSG